MLRRGDPPIAARRPGVWDGRVGRGIHSLLRCLHAVAGSALARLAMGLPSGYAGESHHPAAAGRFGRGSGGMRDLGSTGLPPAGCIRPAPVDRGSMEASRQTLARAPQRTGSPRRIRPGADSLVHEAVDAVESANRLRVDGARSLRRCAGSGLGWCTKGEGGRFLRAARYITYHRRRVAAWGALWRLVRKAPLCRRQV